MPEVASQTLDFVGRELNVTLAEARTALENYVEQPDNINLLERCTQELHQVQGVLRVLEIYGAALLAEEMEQVASYLLQTASERKSQAESLDALMRAMVQLPSYLERVLAGGRDLALVLLPLLNDLRAVRGSALLSEGTLLLLNLKSDKQAAPVASAPGEPPLTVEQWARRLRARFQVGLIGWIRGERLEQNLDILAAVAQKLEQIATRQPVFQLWWVTGAVIEALQENGLEGGVSVKRLLGLGDREIRRLYEQGEPRYAQTPAVELLNNLLYYVGRAESNGPRVQAVRASFRLQELLPVDESVEQERENLSAPSVKLMQTVAVAIREDLSKVKDVLDIFVRRGAGQPKELASQVEMLRKIGDTLGVLGLGELRGNVQAETERLGKIVEGTLPADESTLVQIAATLIGVEDKLDSQLVGLIRPKAVTDLDEDEDNDFQQVQAAVLRECILNLARIKESISQNVGGTLDAAGLDAWQDLMRGLKAGLLMLGKARAVEVIEGITGQLKRVMQPGGQGLPPGFMDRLADAIVSVEYYMETLQAGRSDPWYMLDNAQACVQALEHQQTPVLPTLPPVEPSAYAKTLAITSKAVFGAEDHGSTMVGAQTPLTTTRTNVPPLAETADPELVKLFIEEAHEELEKIKKFFPAWDQNPMEREALVTVRRSFHTLKGSGRMVGARELGEFAWSIENLLNRVLDNTLTRSPAIVEVLRDAVSALPGMIEQLETGRPPRGDPQAIAARANALASGKPLPAAGAAKPAPNTASSAAPAAAATSTAQGTPEKTQVISPLSTSTTATFSTSNVLQVPPAGTAASPGALPAFGKPASPGLLSAGGQPASPGALSASGKPGSPGLLPAGGQTASPGLPSAGGISASSTPLPTGGISGSPGPLPGGGQPLSPGPLPAGGQPASPGQPSAGGISASSTPLPTGGISGSPGPLPGGGQPSSPGPLPAGGQSASPGLLPAGGQPASPGLLSAGGQPSSPGLLSAGGQPASSTPPIGTPPRRPTFAQSVTGLHERLNPSAQTPAGASSFSAFGGDRHAQTIVDARPASSLSDDNVADLEQSLLEEPTPGAADAKSSNTQSFSANTPESKRGTPADSKYRADVGSPGSDLRSAGSDVTSPGSELGLPELHQANLAARDSEPTSEDLAADLNNLDLLLPEETAGEAPAEESILLEDDTQPSAEDEDWLLSGASEAAPVAGASAANASGPWASAPSASAANASGPRASAASASAANASATSPSAGAGTDAPLTRAVEEEDPASAQSEPDAVLRDIYSRETANHVATVRTYLDREVGVSEPHPIPEEVYRACHTLSGSSKMAQARHGVRLAEPMDHWLRRVFNSSLGLLNQDLALLSDCMLAMEAVVSHLDEVTGYFQNHQVLNDRIAQAEKILDQRIANASQEQAETSVMGDEDELIEDAGDFDPEVASIFCEEAMELIEVCESALSEWRLEPESADYRSALKRPLHTLKGGARMAGITAMGDLSHELESLVMQVDNGSVAADDNMFDVIQASLDELARMRESVANGGRVASARQMIARIHSLTNPKGAALAGSPPTIKPAAPAGEPYRRSPPGFTQTPVVPQTPQSFAPPPPALTPAEQETPAAAANTSPAAGYSEDERSSVDADAFSAESDASFANAEAELADLLAIPTDARATSASSTVESSEAVSPSSDQEIPSADAEPISAGTETSPEFGSVGAGALSPDDPESAAISDYAAARADLGLPESDASAGLDAELRDLESAADKLRRDEPAETAAELDSDFHGLQVQEGDATPATAADGADDSSEVEIRYGDTATHGALNADSDSAFDPDAHHGTDLPSDAETQLNRALPPHVSLLDTVEAPIPEFGPTGDTLESAPEFDTAATSAPTSGDLAAELLASYPDSGQSEEQASEEETTGETPAVSESGSYDLSSELADLTVESSAVGEHVEITGDSSFLDANAADANAAHAGDANAADANAGDPDVNDADAHVASDYMAARDSAANEEVTPVRSWTPESTQETPALSEDGDRRGFSAFAQEPPLSEDQPGTPSSQEPSFVTFASSDSSTEDAAESFLGDWATPGAGEAAPIWPPADHQQAPSSAGDSFAAGSDHSASVPASTFGEQTPAADDATSFPAAASSELDLDHEARQPTSGADRQAFGADQTAFGGDQPAFGADGATRDSRASAASDQSSGGNASDRSAFNDRADVDIGTGSTGPAGSTLASEDAVAGHPAFSPAAVAAAAAATAAAAAAAAAAQSTTASAGAKSVSANLSRNESKASEEGLVPPQAVPPGREPVAPAERQEMARVDAELLDQLLNISGEASIARSRLEQQLGSIDFNLGELSRTVTRLKEQLRNLEIETEAQILHRHEDESTHRGDFDPLELDRYSSIQQFSRALAETANDVGSIQQLLENLGKETQNLLQQQARTITELQNGLMRTRMVPFQRHVQRLSRIVRQAAADTQKKAELVVEGASGELDRQVLEQMLPPFEHMLRNAVVHGIEKPLARAAAGKPEAGKIVLELHREGAEVMVRLIDDGAGMNLKAIRDKGAALGLIAPGVTISDEDAMQLILEPGFSTAGTITQQAGRGVGMDVVATEIKRLGGALHMETKPGQGTVFTIRLPFTLAISHALVVRTGDEYYALPLPTVEGVLRLSKAEVLAHLGKDASAFDYGGQKYRFQHLATFVQLEASPLPEQDVTIPVVLVRAGEHSTGLVADELVGSREIVVKSVGPQISSIRGISGATILGDGRIVIILDINALVRAEWRGRASPTQVAPKDKSDKRVFAMVVDDSITVRRVTQRLLERNGMRVLTARDGMDAVTLLQDNIPDIILLDIEMPRMDGYEVAAHVRNDPRLKDVPIIMITSRVGEKHRARAIELGVDDYLGKPYQEAQLLDAIAPLVERHRQAQGSGSFERLTDARV